MIRVDALRSWPRLKECRELDTSEYVEWDSKKGLPKYHRLVFVSHRWIRPSHPDPDAEQLRELQRRLAQGAGENDLVFYDYCSLLQRPRTPDENAVFYRDLGALEDLSKAAEKVIILSEGYHDYRNRSWCFFEAIVSEGNIHFFHDQADIKADLDFLTFLMSGEIPQITAYDLSYKLNVEEAEIIVATFQHLNACRATQPEDVPLIKEQMVAHFNQRRLTSFGRIITGLAKYFDVSFALIPAGHELIDIKCKPYFEEPEWTRLPAIEPNLMRAIVGGRMQPSVFALPVHEWEAAKRHHTRGFIPALRLSMSGVDDHLGFLRSFQDDPNWQRYIVRPVMIGDVKGDPFPTIDHIIHTALEHRPGFVAAKDCIYFLLMAAGAAWGLFARAPGE